jgi:imidazolonepropionase-like amidohydrolase
MAEAGIGAAEAIRAATAGSATALGLADDRGTIEPGLAADLVVVDGDPLADPAILLDPARIVLVFRDGRIVAGEGAGQPPATQA